MSRTSRSSAGSRPRSVSTPKRCPAAGDNPLTNLDEELRTVLRKEYDDGEVGKNEALKDLKTVLKEVSQDPMAQAIDKVMPRFLTATSGESGAEEPSERRQKYRSRSKNATPRHFKLTARPTARGKSNQRQLQGETASVPNIPPKSFTDQDNSTTRPVTSAPRLHETATRYSSSSFISEKSSSASTTDGEVVEFHYSVTTLTSTMVRAEVGEEGGIDEEELPFTENLLEVRTDTEDSDDIWRSDIVELTRIKSAPKGSQSEADGLELKYTEPIWPHQLFLNQILARRPRLTHLVLDGSELRFLRDLGSSLQSLLTLSVCDCGLRSLDGAYAMPNLRTLIARSNMICIPTQCSFLSRLSYLDLSSNPISTFDEFGHLMLCGELRILKLHNTPVATHPNFNKEMKRLVPQLKEIHPSQYDTLEELKQIRKQGQQRMWEESKQGEPKGENRIMPSLAYNTVKLDEPKSGIAYQQIPKIKENLQLNHQLPESENEGAGDIFQVYMATKFLQHLEEAMPPSTAEMQEAIQEAIREE